MKKVFKTPYYKGLEMEMQGGDGQLLARVVFDTVEMHSGDEMHMNYKISMDNIGSTIKAEFGEDMWIQLSFPFEEMNPQ